MNKAVFITGGSRGIGKSLVETFASAGYRTGFTWCSTEITLSDYDCPTNNLLPVQCDISSRESIRLALDKCRERFGPVSILINNAAIAQEKPFATITDSDWQRMMLVNLQAPFMLAQEVLPDMHSQSWGRIINITSIGGQWGGKNQVHYAAAKAGLINLTRSLSKLYSSQGIQTNAIAIGLVKTDMTEAELTREDGKEKVATIPIGRIAETADVASVAMFLASEGARYITGQTINVNGGMLFS